jgi:hypothetical protein
LISGITYRATRLPAAAAVFSPVGPVVREAQYHGPNPPDEAVKPADRRDQIVRRADRRPPTASPMNAVRSTACSGVA